MKTFKGYILEGGNLVVDDVSAAPIKITDKNRHQVQSDLHGMMSALHDTVKAHTGGEIFGKGQKALHTGSAFSGSTAHLFDKKISDKELVKHKSEMGDADVKVDKKHFDALQPHLQKGSTYGKYTVAGYSKGGGEHHVLMKQAGSRDHCRAHHAQDTGGDDHDVRRKDPGRQARGVPHQPGPRP